MLLETTIQGLLEVVRAVDATVAEAVIAVRAPLLTKVMTSVTGLGSATAALVFLGLFHRADWREELWLAAPALLLTGVVVGVAMLTIQRPFPPGPVCLTDGGPTVTSSFPSGHAAAVTVFAATARRSDALPFAPVAALAVLVAVSRVYLGTHYLSDTAVGVLIGVLSVLAVRELHRRTALRARVRAALSRE